MNKIECVVGADTRIQPEKECEKRKKIQYFKKGDTLYSHTSMIY